jgi:peptidoglycan hydrolase-like protein with peptidoglycan-binding domain
LKPTLSVLSAALAACLAAMTGVTATTSAQGQQSTAPAASTEATKETIREAQKNLKALGYEPGPASGEMTPKTQHALESFQHEHMPDPITKTLDKPTLDLVTALSLAPAGKAFAKKRQEDERAEADARNRDLGSTPLMRAALAGNVDTVKALLASRADVRVKKLHRGHRAHHGRPVP